jgi:hypothetical protein
MPYKFNESRRHRIPTTKYWVTNWPEYDAALARWGGLTIWFTEEAIAAWHAPATGKPGGQRIHRQFFAGAGVRVRRAEWPGLVVNSQ